MAKKEEEEASTAPLPKPIPILRHKKKTYLDENQKQAKTGNQFEIETQKNFFFGRA